MRGEQRPLGVAKSAALCQVPAVSPRPGTWSPGAAYTPSAGSAVVCGGERPRGPGRDARPGLLPAWGLFSAWDLPSTLVACYSARSEATPRSCFSHSHPSSPPAKSRPRAPAS